MQNVSKISLPALRLAASQHRGFCVTRGVALAPVPTAGINLLLTRGSHYVLASGYTQRSFAKGRRLFVKVIHVCQQLWLVWCRYSGGLFIKIEEILIATQETSTLHIRLCTLRDSTVTLNAFDSSRFLITKLGIFILRLGGKIYALGGYNGRSRMSSGERYEPQRNQWEMIPSMHRQRSDASAAALQDKIYIVGGFNGREVLNSAEVFDVETNQWSYIHPMLNPRSGVSLVAFRDSLYALGGFDGFTRLSSGNLMINGTPNFLVTNSK